MAEVRIRFTLVTVLAAVLAVGVVAVLLVAWLPRAHERARRDACSMRLAAFTRAAWQYEDDRLEFPPLATEEGGASWYALLAPYLADGGQAMSLCPSRVSARLARPGEFAKGLPLDYTAISTADWNLRWSNAADGVLVLARPDGRGGFSSGVTATDLVDGQGTTAMFSEKHLRPEWLGGPWDGAAGMAAPGPLLERLAGERAGNRSLAQGPQDADEWKFGSWHDRVVNFAMCDESVRPMTTRTDLKVLSRLTCRNDTQRDGGEAEDAAPVEDPRE